MPSPATPPGPPSAPRMVLRGMRALVGNTTVRLALKVLVTAAILYVLLRAIDIDQAVQRVRTVDPLLLGAALLLGVSQAVLVMAWRWGLVLKLLGGAVRFRRLLLFMTVSLFFNEVLPSTIGGDTMRVLLLRRAGRPIGQAAQSVLLERGLGLASLLLLAVCGAAVLLPFAADPLPLWIIMAVALAALASAALLLVLAHLGLRLPWALLQRLAQALIDTTAALRRDPRRVLALIGLSFLGQVVIFVGIWFVAQALHVPLDLWQALAIMPAIILVASVPISLAEWGVREGAMVVGLGLVGVSATDALTVSLVYGLLFLMLGLVGGMVWLCCSGKVGTAAEEPAS